MQQETPQHVQLAGTATVGPKGQVVIPVEIREQMGIAPGEKLVALYIPSKSAICFVSQDKVQYLIDKMGAHVAAIRSLVHKEETTEGE